VAGRESIANFGAEMRFGRASAYALVAMLYLADEGMAESLSVGQIAHACGVPVEYLRKILQLLTKARLVQSERGRNGGFRLGKVGRQISILHVIEAIEGPIDETAIMGNLTMLGTHNRAKAGIHRCGKRVTRQFRECLAQTSLAELLGD
jgi:Rrf2 family protein